MRTLLIGAAGVFFLAAVACAVAAGIYVADGAPGYAREWLETAGLLFVASMGCGLIGSD